MVLKSTLSIIFLSVFFIIYSQNPFTLYSKNLSNGIYWLKILNVDGFTPLKLIVN